MAMGLYSIQLAVSQTITARQVPDLASYIRIDGFLPAPMTQQLSGPQKLSPSAKHPASMNSSISMRLGQSLPWPHSMRNLSCSCAVGLANMASNMSSEKAHSTPALVMIGPIRHNLSPQL